MCTHRVLETVPKFILTDISIMSRPTSKRKLSEMEEYSPEEGTVKQVRLTEDQNLAMYKLLINNSRFMEIERIPELLPANLDNDILNVYKEENFPGADYKVMEILLRLASLQVSAAVRQPDSVPIRIVSGSNHLVPLHEGRFGDNTEQYAYPEPETTTAAQTAALQRQAFEKLDELDGLVSFTTHKLSGGATVNIRLPRRGGRGPVRYSKRSKIKYSQEQYDELVNYTNSGDDPAYLTLLRWSLGSIIAHETMHALTNAQSYSHKTFNKVYYSANADEAPIAEIGFEFERRVHDGVHLQLLYQGEKNLQRHQYADGSYSAIRGVVVAYEYPNSGLVEHYTRNNFPMGHRQACSDWSGKPYLGWRVSMYQLSKYLNKECWSNEVANSGPAALRPPKDAGFFFVADVADGDTTHPYWPPRGGSQIVPPEYEVGRFCDVVPAGSGQSSGQEEEEA